MSSRKTEDNGAGQSIWQALEEANQEPLVLTSEDRKLWESLKESAGDTPVPEDNVSQHELQQRAFARRIEAVATRIGLDIKIMPYPNDNTVQFKICGRQIRAFAINMPPTKMKAQLRKLQERLGPQ